ncbi:aspartate/glutamate racemase family protein [Salinicola rhizosphaerae]|uniref:Hydantoin racemase n=1 Tax=Salinicola rhizosphaerae TaxID=1443141 RepID=A0ABQ3DU63_9GAMM|nr:aspartate/glutamate racemase family protein [Salinicola rhizosphaerae]GHB14859.1 hydantoin racemase [Salinicola rhizosphaerae]
MTRIGILRVVTSADQTFLEHHQRLIQASLAERYSTLAFETRCLPDQPNGIHDAATLARALPQIEALARDWAPTLDGLIVSCAADPGLKKLKATLSIPVVGAGEACCERALTLGTRIGAIGIELDAPPVFHARLGERLMRYRQPDGVACTHDIHTDAGKLAIIAAVQALEAEGADTIALACTGMATTDVAALVAPYTNLPVVNPVLAAGAVMARRLTDV